MAGSLPATHVHPGMLPCLVGCFPVPLLIVCVMVGLDGSMEAEEIGIGVFGEGMVGLLFILVDQEQSGGAASAAWAQTSLKSHKSA
jgi:hypothetical protein